MYQLPLGWREYPTTLLTYIRITIYCGGVESFNLCVWWETSRSLRLRLRLYAIKGGFWKIFLQRSLAYKMDCNSRSFCWRCGILGLYVVENMILFSSRFCCCCWLYSMSSLLPLCVDPLCKTKFVPSSAKSTGQFFAVSFEVCCCRAYAADP